MIKRDPRGRRSSIRPDLHISETANRIGISQSYLTKILAGDQVPSLEIAEKLAVELGLSHVGQLRGELEQYRRNSRSRSSRTGRNRN